MRHLLSIMYFLLLSSSYAQKFSAIVLDGADQPEVKAKIVNIANNNKTESNADGYFYIEAKPRDSLKIIPKNKKSFYYTVSNFLEAEYEIYFINSEDKKIQEVQGVTITSKKIKPVVERFNANVIDYIPFKNGRLLTVCSLRNKFKILIEANDEVIEEFDLDINRVQELLTDVFGNYQLVCKDSTYQIVLSEELIKQAVIPTEDFDEKIRNIVYNDNKSIVNSFLSNHNKAFRLIKKTRGDENPKIIHSIIDLEALKEANRYYNLIVNTYNNSVPDEFNIITNGIWTGDLTHLGENEKLITMIMWYNNIMSKKINVHSFPHNDSILIFDLDNYLIKSIGESGEIFSQIPIDNQVQLKYFKILRDPITNNFFCYDPRNATLELYEINLKKGTLTPCLTLDGVRFPRKIKVFNGWMYFIELNDASFNKLYRAKIET